MKKNNAQQLVQFYLKITLDNNDHAYLNKSDIDLISEGFAKHLDKEFFAKVISDDTNGGQLIYDNAELFEPLEFQTLFND